ncbi:MAG: DUF3794 domain-containing protein [Firmicutes bacterium]|jgi:LysM repeat protein|nr:DUF3794 domain-containing protein [Bacillota bacterium]
MSLRVKEERLYVENQLGDQSLQAVFQGTVELPTNAPEIARVVWVKGRPVVSKVTAGEDQVKLQGAIDIQMVYVPEVLEGDPVELQRVEWPGAVPFDHYVEIVGVEPHMAAHAAMEVVGCEYEVRSDQRVIDLDVVTQTSAMVRLSEAHTVITSAAVGPPKKLAVDEITINTRAPILEAPFHKEITGIVELPEDTDPMAKILDLNCQIVIPPVEVVQGGMHIRGTAAVDIIYTAVGGAVRRAVFENQLPFEVHHTDAVLKPEMGVEVDTAPRWEGFVVNDGRAIRIELVVSGTAKVYRKQAVRILTDLACPTDESIETRKETIYANNLVNEKVQQGTVQGVIELGDAAPPIRELIRATARPQVNDYRIDEDKITIDGTLDVELIYLAYTDEELKPLHAAVFPAAIPMQQTIIVGGAQPGMKVHFNTQVKDIKTDLINRETIEVFITLRTEVQVLEEVRTDVVVEAIEMTAADPDPPSITYVFVQEKDTLWKLARQYHTDESAILEANSWLQAEPDQQVRPGDKICIPRK